jgi:hypothetical protein
MSKIQRNHLEKPAYIYIRQSSMAQVRHHQESTERQYALKDRAIDLGWKEVRVLDGDLGISGAQMAGRNDFKIVVTDVSMRKVGAVFALEASRLARNSTDWHRLLDRHPHYRRGRLLQSRGLQRPTVVGLEGDDVTGGAPLLARPPPGWQNEQGQKG